MAPPVNRRTGYSRRAQYSTFAAYVAGVLGVGVGGALLASAVFGHSTFGWLQTAAADVQAPAARAAAQTRAAAGNAINSAGGFFASGQEVARLRQEVALARTRAIEAQAVANENERLKALLKLNEGDGKPITNAWLIAATGSSTRRYATISAGADKGVQTGMPVRTASGLIGRVLEVGHNASRVLLVTDTASVVPVRRAKDGIPALPMAVPMAPCRSACCRWG